MEVERPVGYVEYINEENPWDELGMRIKWTSPVVPLESKVAMLDPLHIRLCVECKKPVPLRDLSASAWTCMFHKDNIEGIYREIKLPYDESSRRWDDWGVTTYEFSATVYPTHTDEFRLTYIVKFRDKLIWENYFRDDHILNVRLPREINEWTHCDRHIRIVENLHIGNYLALLEADELNFDAVLNLMGVKEGTGSMDNPTVDPPKARVVRNEEIPIGAGREINPDEVYTIVNWLKGATKVYKKILVGDKEGLGRCGSALTAYVFANNPNLTFEEAYQFVMSRGPIYCHKGLKDTLYRLYPRD